MLGELVSAECRRVLAHLVSGCAECKRTAAKLWTAAGRPDRPESRQAAAELSSYDGAFARAFASAEAASIQADREQRDAPELVAKLLAQPSARQLLILRNSRQFATWGVCERLLGLVWDLRFDDPRRAEEVARLAVAAVGEVEPQRYGAPLVADLRARAWAAFANTLRVRSSFAAAEEAFAEAEAQLAAGTGNPLARAWVLDLRSSLASALGRQEVAERLLDRAIAAYRRGGQRHSLGRALVKKGMIRGYRGDPEGEALLVRQGLDLADAEAEPQLVVAGWHNLILGLHERGRNREALEHLVRARPVYLHHAHRTVLMRFQWLEGNIAAALGRLDQAEGCLREVRRAFIEEGLATDSALVSLDLAGVLARLGRAAEVEQIAVETLGLFRGQPDRAETLAALALLRQAAQAERVSSELLRRVADAVRRESVTNP